MEAKYTKGPWENILGETNILVCDSHNKALVCVMAVREGVIENTKLISSAPELLEALQAMVEVFAKPHNETLNEVVNAKKAIAKATE